MVHPCLTLEILFIALIGLQHLEHRSSRKHFVLAIRPSKHLIFFHSRVTDDHALHLFFALALALQLRMPALLQVASLLVAGPLVPLRNEHEYAFRIVLQVGHPQRSPRGKLSPQFGQNSMSDLPFSFGVSRFTIATKSRRASDPITEGGSGIPSASICA